MISNHIKVIFSNTIIHQIINKIGLKYFPLDNLALKATAEGRAGRDTGAFLDLKVAAGRVTCEDGGSYQCKITHTGANNESLTVTSASIAVAVVGKTHILFWNGATSKLLCVIRIPFEYTIVCKI